MLSLICTELTECELRQHEELFLENLERDMLRVEGFFLSKEQQYYDSFRQSLCPLVLTQHREVVGSGGGWIQTLKKTLDSGDVALEILTGNSPLLALPVHIGQACEKKKTLDLGDVVLEILNSMGDVFSVYSLYW